MSEIHIVTQPGQEDPYATVRNLGGQYGSGIEDEETIRAVALNPASTGKILRESGRLDAAILHAFTDTSPAEAKVVFDAVLGGLTMADVLDWKPVRFPRLHKLLGRIVLTDDRRDWEKSVRYFLPKDSDLSS